MWTTSSNPIPRYALSFAFFAASQSKYFTACALRPHIGVGSAVPARVAQTRPEDHQSAANANQGFNKKRA